MFLFDWFRFFGLSYRQEITHCINTVVDHSVTCSHAWGYDSLIHYIIA
jgi:hypothetical protein